MSTESRLAEILAEHRSDQFEDGVVVAVHCACGWDSGYRAAEDTREPFQWHTAHLTAELVAAGVGFVGEVEDRRRDDHEYWAAACTCGMGEQERTGHYPEHESWCEVPSPLDEGDETTSKQPAATPARDDVEALIDEAIYGGAEAVDPDERGEVVEAVLAVIAQRDREQQAKALREAADRWDDPAEMEHLKALADAKYRAGGPSMPPIWLRDRAEQIERGES